MRRILLADADAFYVAVARAVDPDGAGKAPLLIVGGSRESRGVVCSASYETRKFGVRRTMSPNQIVAYNVAKARALRGWTQEEAAEALKLIGA